MPTFTPVTANQPFTGSNGDAIGANWTQLRHVAYGSTARIIGNKLGGHFSPANSVDTTDQTHVVLYRWAGSGTPGADQYAQCVLSNMEANGNAPQYRGGLGVRLDTNTDAGTNGYLCYVCDNTTTKTVVIMKLAGATLAGTVLDSRTQTITNSDTILFCASGTSTTVLTLYINGVASTSTYTDSSSAITSGQPGLYLASDESGGTLNGPALDDWIAGNVTTVLPDSPLPRLSPVQLFGPILAQ